MDDLISRQAAMDICDTFNGQGSVWAVIKGYIKALPPVTIAENATVEDCVSRQAAIDACLNGWNKDYKEIMADIKALPPVEQKQGKWIYDRKRDWDGECKYECSECGMGSDVDYNYCMRCGANMCGGDTDVNDK